MEKLFNIGIFVMIGIFVLSSMDTCSSRGSSNTAARQLETNTTINVVTDASENLDLQAVGELLKTVNNAEELERALNSDNPRINNLDLDENDIVDYIAVTEYGNESARGFSLTTELAQGEVQEIASIEIEKTEGFADAQIYGNRQIYGNNHYYHNRFGLTDFLLVAWLFSDRPFYRSPYSYGGSPYGYRPYRPVATDVYRGNTQRNFGNKTFSSGRSSTFNSTLSSPNAGKSATVVKAPLKNPTQAQRSFQARNPSKQVGSGGFGRSSAKPSVRSSSSSRSGSSFGGGK
jgi:hypothetical protein